MTFVVGTVRDMETERPLPGVKVRLSWSAPGVAGVAGAAGDTVTEESVTDARGRYRFFGVPADVELTAQAAHGTTAGDAATFFAMPDGIRCQELTLDLAAAPSPRERSPR